MGEKKKVLKNNLYLSSLAAINIFQQLSRQRQLSARDHFLWDQGGDVFLVAPVAWVYRYIFII